MILDRYLLLEFIKPFSFSMVIFALVISVGHLFDRLEVFIRHNVRVGVVLVYLASMLPLWLVQALPICTLIAGVIVIGNLCQSGEMTCLRSGGIPARRVFIPLFIFGVFMTILTFILGDTVMPRSTSFARSLYRRQVDKVGIQKPQWINIISIAKDQKRISAKKLDLENRSMEVVTIESYGENLHLRQELQAKMAKWDPKQGWTFYDGVVRLFSKEGDEIVEEETFDTAQISLPESPEDIVPLQVLPEELSVRQLKQYIRRINELGIPALTERVQYHLKFAFPFTHLLVLAIGIPIAFKTTSTGGGGGKKSFSRMKSLALAMVVALAYFMLIAFGQALGESRKLEPWAGVWLANAVFLIVGILLLRNID